MGRAKYTHARARNFEETRRAPFASRLLEIARARVYFARPTIAIAKIRDYSQSKENLRAYYVRPRNKQGSNSPPFQRNVQFPPPPPRARCTVKCPRYARGGWWELIGAIDTFFRHSLRVSSPRNFGRARVCKFARPTIASAKIRDYSQSTTRFDELLLTSFLVDLGSCGGS